MKIANDNLTFELPLGLEPAPAPKRRGRGRPTVESPKTPAQRASDYRKRKKFLGAKEQKVFSFVGDEK